MPENKGIQSDDFDLKGRFEKDEGKKMAEKGGFEPPMAEKGGFEPPKPVLRACTLSRGVPSASRPLLRTT